LVKPEVDVISQGQGICLLCLSTEGRTGILMSCILFNKKTTVNQGPADEAEKRTNQFDEKTLMDKGQFVNMQIIKSDQDGVELELIECCNMERDDIKFVSMNCDILEMMVL
jgi:hypothetical protein